MPLAPCFFLQNGQPLSRNILTDWLRQIMASARVPGNFSSHSFRIGAATVAARNGVPDHLIQSMGRWSSNAYQLYIRMVFGYWCLGAGWGSEVPCHPCSRFLLSPSTRKRVLDWVVPAFQGCHGYLPCSLASGTPLTF